MNDGGPAFPCGTFGVTAAKTEIPYYMGMSLRDWFAGQALIGLVQVYDKSCHYDRTPITASAYELADAMLKARE